MQKRIQQVLEGKAGSYILPFFWQHGEDEATLRDYMRAIDEANIHEVCVECRPHPDFCGPKWWTDLDIIMEEARSRGMRVWVLDDDHFPTGHCNGAIENAEPELCKQYLNFAATEVAGPMPGAVVDVHAMLHPAPSPFMAPPRGPMGSQKPDRQFDDDRMLGVYAYRMRGKQLGECIDLSQYLGQDRFHWDVPEGHWRIFVVYLTRNAGGRRDYFNICDHDSVRVLIDTVYEPHYARYQDDFGKTFAGFFSDEPCLGNTPPYQFVDSGIGRGTLPLNWCGEMAGMMEERLGADWVAQAPLLWNARTDDQLTARVRFAYMDTLTRCVEKNFSRQIGDWCAEHGVEYIGHIIEDNNFSASMGSSLGHYFRTLNGQHMGGIDCIGGSVFPGGEDRVEGGGYYGNGDFYHFVLGKLGSSHAHVDPRKQGRAMCELYGAYGWGFGVRDMKYLTDHCLVRGINRLVPHAFSPKAFPDPDCPPHFYAHGENPQYRHFATLMAYAQRVCHLIDGGRHVAPVAVLYEGEAYWAGRNEWGDRACRALAEAQIDFDIIPGDLLAEDYTLDGGLRINGETYRALVIPYAQFLPTAVARFTARAAEAGFPVFFLNALPEGVSDSELPVPCFGEVVPTAQLVPTLQSRGIADVQLCPAFPGLRVYHYVQETDLFLLSNESTGSVFRGEIRLPALGQPGLYDPMANCFRPLRWREENGQTVVELELEPYQLMVVDFGAAEAETTPMPAAEGTAHPLSGWTVSLAASKEYPAFRDSWTMTDLEPVSERYPDFSGFVRYETSFESDGGAAVLELDDVRDCAIVWCNGEKAGECICPPYRFPLQTQAGTNTLRIEVATNLERAFNAMDVPKFSMQKPSCASKPTGVIGAATIWTREEQK